MFRIFQTLLISLLLTTSSLFAQTGVSTNAQVPAFIENKGQWESEIKFAAFLPGLKIIVMTDGIVYDYSKTENLSDNYIHSKGHVVKMLFDKGNLLIDFNKTNSEQGEINYFLGNNPDKWVRGVKKYQSIIINEVYRGIDLKLNILDGQLRYDFICRPFANPDNIQIKFDGAFETSLDKNNEIQILTSLGAYYHGNIFAYQTDDDNKNPIQCSFISNNNTFSFRTGDYDKSKELIIDPLVLLSCIGGTDVEIPMSIAYISNGSFVITGWTKSSDFVTTPGAYDTQYKYQEDVFVTKYTISGTSQIHDFTTYVGGASSDLATSVAVDTDKNVYVCGNTISKDFPFKSGFQADILGMTEGFAFKLNAAGSSMIYSTYIGGGKNDYPTKIIAGKDFYAYVCGYTNSTDFPIMGNVYQKTLKGLDDCFLIKISPSGSSLKYGTYFGGTYNDRAFSMYLDSELSVYLTGETNSGDFPVAPFSNQGANPWDRPYNAGLTGGYDCFVTKIKGEGSAVENSTYFGGNADDRGVGIDVDEEYYTIYFAGTTAAESGAAKFPITPTTAVYKTNQGGVDCFFAELDKPKKVTGTGIRQNLIFSTFFGGASNDSIYAMKLDKGSAAAYMVGQTYSLKFPVIGETTTKISGRSDAFLTKFSQNGSEIVYSNYFGSPAGDAARSVAVDERGDSYFCGVTDSVDFPKVRNLIFPKCNGGGKDGFFGKHVYASLFLTSPAGKEVFCPGTVIPVRWNQIGFPNEEIYTIDIGRASDNNYRVMTNTITGNSFNWNVPKDLTPAKDYYVRVVTKSGLFITHPLPISILAPPIIEKIDIVPQQSTYCEGDTITLFMTAIAGNKKIGWYINNNLLSNQTDSILKIDTKIYNKPFTVKAILGGSCNPQDTSDVMSFDIIPATRIISQTGDTVIKFGKNLALKVSTSGKNLHFKWLKDGNEVLGETDSLFILNGVNLSHNGLYKCIVTGDCGELESQEIRITVDTTGTAVYEGTDPDENLIVRIIEKSENNLIVSVSSVENSVCSVELIDINSRVVKSLYEGTIGNGAIEFSLNPNELNSGTYWIVARTSIHQTVKKIQIVN